MPNNFKTCLERKKIVVFSRRTKIVSKELKLALEDLSYAKKAFKDKNYRWAIVQS